jgi:hypothetical protein
MPLPNFHAARLISPDRFAKIVTLQTLPNGVQILGGPLKTDPSGSSKPQSYRFPKSNFTADQARAWLKEHDISFSTFEAAAKTQAFQDPVNVIIYCQQIQAFTQSEIIKMIPAETLARIKMYDEHPFFQAYVLCHEGTSTPKILGEESKPITWTRKAIQSIKNIITKGVRFFMGHNEDSSTDNRRVLGEVVSDTQKEIDGKLSHVVIAYHPKAVRDEVKKYDICSQEAAWNLIETAKGLIANNINKLTGIALQSSENDIPAFAGAKRLGMVQAFNDKKSNLSGELKKMPEDKLINLNDVKNAVRDMGLYPNQIFTIEQMKTDRVFSEIVTENEQLKTQAQKDSDSIKALEAEKKTLSRKTLVISAKTRLKNLMDSGEVTLTDLQKKFIDKNFNEDMEDLSDESLKVFITNQTEVYKKNAEFFNFTETEKEETSQGVQDKSGTQDKDIDPNDMSKAVNNPLLEEDFDTEV